MTTTIVETKGQLIAAIKAAASGDSILLAPGDYGAVSLLNIKVAGEVTISSMSPDDPAVLRSLRLDGVTGLEFRDIEVVVAPGETGVELFNSARIAFSGLDVHGSIDGNPSNDGHGMRIRSSRDVTVEESQFHELTTGVAHRDSRGLDVIGNTFSWIREDGVRGGGSSDVTVSHNLFTEFRKQPGDHSDAIQFWTTNATASARDITVTDNVMLRGEGTRFQGVFIRDESNGKLPFENVVIEGNFLLGTQYQGISVYYGRNVQVTDNTVVGYDDQTSWIMLTEAKGAVVGGNTSSSIRYVGGTDVEKLDNTIVPLASVGDLGLFSQWVSREVSRLADFPGAVTTLATSLGVDVRPPSVEPTWNPPDELDFGMDSWWDSGWIF